MISASQLHAGMAITYEGQHYKVVAAEYHPGQGKMGGATHARCGISPPELSGNTVSVRI
jgi:translation elongation factor P/translation initiation factor 5A